MKAGIRTAGGTRVEFPAIAVCDGIAMGQVGMKYTLASRELICDSVETMLMAHPLDGIELVNCTETIEMSDEPARAIRQKKDSSIVVGLNMLKEGKYIQVT